MSAAADKPTRPRVSVIIPTYRDWDGLALCLKALSEQTYPYEFWEVIVVNNEPGTTPSLLTFPGTLRIVDEEKPGSYAARNTGMRLATGEIFLFTDSDCVPDTRWVEETVIGLQGGSPRVAGAIDIPLPPGRPGSAALFEHVFGLDQVASVARGTGITANMGTSTSVFAAVGPFNENLLSGGDVEWGRRAQRLGFGIEYRANMRVMHPPRATMSALFAKNRRLAGGTFRISRPQGFWRTTAWLLRACLPPVRRYWALRRHDTLTAGQRLQVIFVLYILRIYKSWQMALLILGIRQPVRS